ncbi:MAG: MFS transporter [Hydrococcus sp. RU_2_2]|nr:MFS transporter [Hydrococcus sp. RU_2_2]NJP22450.1 MFS transporter [Hydrococcus sp. CRU_1_1]
MLSLCGLLVNCQVFLAISLIWAIAQAFGVSQLTAAWLGSAYSFAYALGFLVCGAISDRYGRKQVMIIGLLTFTPITLSVGFSPSFQMLILLRAIQGFVGATFVPTAIAYISEVLPVPMRPVGLACMTTGLLLAGIVAQVYASTIALNYGWRWVFWGLAIAYTVFVFILATQISQDARQRSNVSLLSVYRSIAALLGRPAIVAVYTAGFTLLFSFVAMYSGLGSYAAEQYGVDQNGLFLIRLAGAPGILLSPLSGKFVQKWGSKKVAIGALIVAAIGLVLEPIASSLPLLVMATVLFVTGIAFAAPALLSLLAALAADAKAAAFAFYTFVLFTGASFAPLVVQLTRSIGFPGLCIGLISILLAGAASVKFGVINSQASLGN